jgi:hypothetical protein
MSKRVNVNPGQYKVGGRLHPGTPTAREAEARQAFTKSKAQDAAEDRPAGQSTPGPRVAKSAGAGRAKKTPARAAAAMGRVKIKP